MERHQLDEIRNKEMEQKRCTVSEEIGEAKAALELKYQIELGKLDREIEFENAQQLKTHS